MKQGKTTKVLYKGQMVNSIDCTPTWSSLVTYLLQCTKEDNPKLREMAEGEFRHMARVADAHVEYLKTQEKKKGNAKGN